MRKTLDWKGRLQKGIESAEMAELTRDRFIQAESRHRQVCRSCPEEEALATCLGFHDAAGCNCLSLGQHVIIHYKPSGFMRRSYRSRSPMAVNELVMHFQVIGHS